MSFQEHWNELRDLLRAVPAFWVLAGVVVLLLRRVKGSIVSELLIMPINGLPAAYLALMTQAYRFGGPALFPSESRFVALTMLAGSLAFASAVSLLAIVVRHVDGWIWPSMSHYSALPPYYGFVAKAHNLVVLGTFAVLCFIGSRMDKRAMIQTGIRRTITFVALLAIFLLLMPSLLSAVVLAGVEWTVFVLVVWTGFAPLILRGSDGRQKF
jgi:hypothetical protein